MNKYMKLLILAILVISFLIPACYPHHPGRPPLPVHPGRLP
ncbi:MAG TPA: hypothetical protein VK654_15705 [Nitrospirota bacterium]|nr:hypothetical protein [Nitrospirota bacterium]